MIMKNGFELVEVAGEHIAVPVDDNATTFKGVVALSEAAYFVLNQLRVHQTKESLLNMLVSEYDVDVSTAEADLDKLISTLFELDLIEE